QGPRAQVVRGDEAAAAGSDLGIHQVAGNLELENSSNSAADLFECGESLRPSGTKLQRTLRVPDGDLGGARVHRELRDVKATLGGIVGRRFVRLQQRGGPFAVADRQHR